MLTFHIAHVDHGWRQESAEEANVLKKMSESLNVPFHCKKLDPKQMKGNLEAACRKERYAFFTSLCKEHQLQAILTGHHQNDQAESIFKRIMEGAHWSRWIGLQPESHMDGVKLLRPFLQLTKKEIEEFVTRFDLPAFDDPTNRQQHFLRARLRETVFPRLNLEFGKNVESSFLEIGEEAKELVDYFEVKLSPLLQEVIRGPWGICLDLQGQHPRSNVEMKFLIRLLCKHEHVMFSREIIRLAAHHLIAGTANIKFEMGQRCLMIDRERIFITAFAMDGDHRQVVRVSPGSFSIGQWQVLVEEHVYQVGDFSSSWRLGWRGTIKCCLPKKSYWIRFANKGVDRKMRKIMGARKVPAFLADWFPFIYDERQICHEFVTGTNSFELVEGESCYKVLMTWQDRPSLCDRNTTES